MKMNVVANAQSKHELVLEEALNRVKTLYLELGLSKRRYPTSRKIFGKK